MRVTVAICTWNRAGLLDQALTSLCAMSVPQGVEWELLIVNNNCTDQTDAVIGRHAAHLPIRRLFEPSPGQSNARNAAIRAAQGELILWTDDDALVGTDWLASYCQAARRWPQAGFYGGPILPWYERPPPRWVQANLTQLQGMLVVRDLGHVERELQATEEVFGVNMAFPRRVLEGRCFAPWLGLKGNEQLRGEETYLQQSLREQGFAGVWVPSASVHHHVPAARLTREYLWQYFVGFGRTQTRLRGLPEGKLLWHAPRWLYRKLATTWGRSLLLRLAGRPSWVHAYVQAARTTGEIAECWQRSPKRQTGGGLA